MELHDTLRCRAVRNAIQCDTVLYDTNDMIKYDTAGKGMVQYGSVLYGTVQYGMARCGGVQRSAVRGKRKVGLRCGAIQYRKVIQ